LFYQRLIKSGLHTAPPEQNRILSHQPQLMRQTGRDRFDFGRLTYDYIQPDPTPPDLTMMLTQVLLDLRTHIWGPSFDLQIRRLHPGTMHKASDTVQDCLPYEHCGHEKQSPKDQTFENMVHECSPTAWVPSPEPPSRPAGGDY